ncbi:MAG: SpoIIE family protein phosphatase [Anaerolineales bacterium]
MTAAPLLALPRWQPVPDPATTVVLLGLLLLMLLLSWLLPHSSPSLRRGSSRDHRPSEFSQGLSKLASASDQEELLRCLTEILHHHFHLDLIQLARKDGHRWHLIFQQDDGPTENPEELRLPSERIPFSNSELAEDQFKLWRSHQNSGAKDRLALPMSMQEEMFGLLILGSSEGRPFDQDSITMLRQIAKAATAGLARETLSDELEERATKMVLLGEVSRRLLSLRPLEERWLDIAPLLSQIFEFAEISIYEVIEGRANLQAASHFSEQNERQEPPPVIQEILKEVIESRQSARFPKEKSHSQAVRMVVPLLVKDRQLGLLHIHRPEGPAFSNEDVGLAEMLAAQMAIAALESQNYAQQQEYNWYNTVMLEVTRHAAQPGDPGAAMRAVLQLTTMLAGANWALLLLPEETGQRLTIGPSAGLSKEIEEQLKPLRLPRQELHLGPPYQESEDPFRLSLPQQLAEPLGQESCLSLILSDGNILLGLLLVGGTTPEGSRLPLLAGIGHQISMRIENTRLIEDLATRRSLERELETARRIQQSFMPLSLPEPPNWQVGATWMAARQVGGDFFDFIPIAMAEHGPRWGVVIADVADKGVPAALFMALCRTLLRSIADSNDDPAQSLDRLNQLILSDTHAELFVSLFYAIWEPATGRLIYANGGHNPPLLFIDGQSPIPVRGSGMVLGVSDRARYQAQEIRLEPSDMLVMYTDGVTEAMNADGVFFGNESLINAIQRIHGEPAQAIADGLRDAVIEFSATPDPPDDLTTVVLKRLN